MVRGIATPCCHHVAVREGEDRRRRGEKKEPEQF
jgi:hypothetical protein